MHPPTKSKSFYLQLNNRKLFKCTWSAALLSKFINHRKPITLAHSVKLMAKPKHAFSIRGIPNALLFYNFIFLFEFKGLFWEFYIIWDEADKSLLAVLGQPVFKWVENWPFKAGWRDNHLFKMYQSLQLSVSCMSALGDRRTPLYWVSTRPFSPCLRCCLVFLMELHDKCIYQSIQLP